MRTSRREFVKLVMASGIALSLSRLAIAEEPGFAARETLPGRQSWNPAATGAGPHRRRRQGNRSQALRLRFPRRRSPGLAAENVARHAHPGPGRDARLCRHGPLAPDRSVEAFGGGNRRRSRAHRHARSRILCRRSVLPGRQDAALSRPAGGAVDLRGLRHLRSGAARAARRLREIRRGDRPRRDAQLRRLSLHSRRRPDARGARRLLAGQGRLGQSRDVSRTRGGRYGRRSRCRRGRPMPKPRPMANRSVRNLRRTIRLFWCSTANSKPNPSTDVSRAGKRPGLV